MIDEGIYPPGSRLPSETELPRMLKVSQQTVRRALNDLVREGLIVRRQGSGSYVTDRSTTPILPGRRLRLAVLLNTGVEPRALSAGYLALMMQGALEEWGMWKTAPVFDDPRPHGVTRAAWSRADGALIVECLGEAKGSVTRRPPFDAVRNGRYDGILSLSVIETDWLKRVVDLGPPCVVVDFPTDRMLAQADHVFVDPLPGFRDAITYFAERGLTRIHYVGKTLWCPAPFEEMDVESWRDYRVGRQRIDPDSLLRQTAYRQAMGELSLPVCDDWMHQVHWNKAEQAALVDRLSDLPETDRPQAIVCYDLRQAEALMATLLARGLELEGAGVNGGLLWDGMALPVNVDLKEMGAAGAALLVSRLQRPSRPYFRVSIAMSFEHPGGPDANDESRITERQAYL
jgi:DNA-binding LacI/PurR family transcriptional regulator